MINKNILSLNYLLICSGILCCISCKKEVIPIATAQLLDYSTNLPIANGRIEITDGTGGDALPDEITYSDSSGYFTYSQYDQLKITVAKEGYWNPHSYSWDHYSPALSTVFLFRQGIAKIILSDNTNLNLLNNRIRFTIGDSAIFIDYQGSGVWFDSTIININAGPSTLYAPTITGAINVVQSFSDDYGPTPGQFVWKMNEDTSFISMADDTAIVTLHY